MSLRDSIKEKQEWNALQKRAKALPHDYWIVYKEMQTYLLTILPYDIKLSYQTLIELVELFEAGARDGKDVLDVTGKDVATFADNLKQNERN